MKHIRRRLTYANVMSSIAVFLILGGATAFAAQKIGANEIKANSIGTGKVKKEAITTSKIKNGAVTGAKVNLGSLGKVPSASSADTAALSANSNALGGLAPSAFEPRVQWATVKSDGTILAQSGGISVTEVSTNDYLINFGSSVVNRGAMVSGRYLDPDFEVIAVDEPCAGPANTLECPLAAAKNNPNYLLVQTHTPGNAVAEGFNVLLTP